MIISNELLTIITEISKDNKLAVDFLKLAKNDNPDATYYYLDFSKDDKTKFSYLTKDRVDRIKKEHPDNPDKMWELYRYKGKIASIIVKIMKDMVGEETFKKECYIYTKDADRFFTAYKGIMFKPIFEYQIVEGKNIKKYYHHNKYDDRSGNLGGSCMNGSNCQDYLDIYANNPDNIKMLILRNPTSDTIYGRALLWYNDEYNIMDKVYCLLDEYKSYFEKWAIANGYYYRQKQTWNASINLVNPNGEYENIKTKIKLKNFVFDAYPYVDTFKWLDEDGYIYNYAPEREDLDNVKLMTLCDGGYTDGDSLKMCDIDNMYYSSSDVYQMDYSGEIVNCSCNHACYLGAHDIYALKKDTKKIYHVDGEFKHSYYIYSDEYDHLNDKKLIDRYLRESKSYWKQFKNSEVSKYGYDIKDKLDHYEASVVDDSSNDSLDVESSPIDSGGELDDRVIDIVRRVGVGNNMVGRRVVARLINSTDD